MAIVMERMPMYRFPISRRSSINLPVKADLPSQFYNLEAGTKYYINAYLTDGSTPVYGKEISYTSVAVSVTAFTTIVTSATLSAA